MADSSFPGNESSMDCEPGYLRGCCCLMANCVYGVCFCFKPSLAELCEPSHHKSVMQKEFVKDLSKPLSQYHREFLHCLFLLCVTAEEEGFVCRF